MNLDSRFAQLENGQFVPPTSEDKPRYIFKHGLVQGAAYTSLLKQDRKTLHRKAGGALESALPEDLDEYAALLARHCAGGDAFAVRLRLQESPE